MTRQTFRVDAVHCQSCSSTIRQALDALPGVDRTEVYVGVDTMTVAFDAERVRREAIAEAAAKRIPLAGRPRRTATTGRGRRLIRGGGRLRR